MHISQRLFINLNIKHLIILIIAVISSKCDHKEEEDNNPLVYTVATSETDGFQRYLYSAKEYNINPIVLGLGQEWKGGDVLKGPGGGFKVNLLLKELEKYKEQKNRIALFTDAYDVIFLGNLNEIIKRFKNTGARILFSAEAACWPNAELAKLYPVVTLGKPYLNSGLYMGYVPELIQLLNYSTLSDADDDQLFFTRAYLNEHLRNHLNFKLDHKSEIFQNLQGAYNEVELYSKSDKEGSEFALKNVVTHTEPLILHGNGPSKLYLNSLANYLAHSWTTENGCHFCNSNLIKLDDISPENLPLVFLALFIEIPTPFIEEQLEKIAGLDYPKNRIHLFVHNNVQYHEKHVKSFVEKYGPEYLSIKEIKPDDGTTEMIARDLSLDQFLIKKCELYFAVDSIAHLDNPSTLRLLIEQNRTIVAPLLTRPGKAWSNFWGALTSDGYYARSNDYMDIVHNNRRGLWNVPFVSASYLINSTLFRMYDRKNISFVHEDLDSDMAFCERLRNLNVFMYVSNRVDFGHLVTPETFDITKTNPDMYQLFDNEFDWEKRYIHPDYKENLTPGKKPAQPCPDVYWFPIVSVRFCNDLVEMMEAYGKWSDGSNQDNRLEGGYEAVPTRDIHMTQVDYDRHWLHFLNKYVSPLQESVFVGYYHSPPRSLMNFVVRYRPDEQPSLRPHHDSSTYTINIALNRAGIDYEGGGCRFIRYNCSVVDTKQGWILIHPGRLTHFHEGLFVSKGTRYIMVSFVDP